VTARDRAGGSKLSGGLILNRDGAAGFLPGWMTERHMASVPVHEPALGVVISRAVLRTSRNPRRAFTLIELLVVIAIIGILAALLLPVLSRTKAKAQGALCRNCGRQLMLGVAMYTADNNDLFPPNPDDGNTVPGHNWCPGQAGLGGPQEFDPDVLKDPNRSLLISYLSGGVSMFKCPSDKRMGIYNGTDPAKAGQQVPAARSFSMSQSVGTICPAYDSGNGHSGLHDGVPNLSVNGPWLNNDFNHRRNSPWRTFGKASAIAAPGPSMLWVIVDEDVNGLNDASFAFAMESPVWRDAPGIYHNGGCGFAFADGHSETHTWISKSPKQAGSAPITGGSDLQDWLWLRERTSSHVSGTMPPPR